MSYDRQWIRQRWLLDDRLDFLKTVALIVHPDRPFDQRDLQPFATTS